jgi:hypothetical protein
MVSGLFLGPDDIRTMCVALNLLPQTVPIASSVMNYIRAQHISMWSFVIAIFLSSSFGNMLTCV